MERLFKDHLKDKGGWNHSHKELKTDQDTMTELGMCVAEKICVETWKMLSHLELKYGMERSTV
jgi:hypothetical protein